MEKNFLPLRGTEPRLLGSPALTQSLYRFLLYIYFLISWAVNIHHHGTDRGTHHVTALALLVSVSEVSSFVGEAFTKMSVSGLYNVRW
jgi:hypothetical protein